MDAQVEAYDIKVGIGTFVQAGGYSGDLDITAFDADAGDVLALGAEVDTDDVAVATLYAQTVTSVSAVAPTLAAGQPAPCLITVGDQDTQVIAGAEVRRADGSLVGYTDGAGRVRDTGVSGSFTCLLRQQDRHRRHGRNRRVRHRDDVCGDRLLCAGGGCRRPGVRRRRVRGWRSRYIQVDDQNGAHGRGTPVHYRVYPTGTTPPVTYETATLTTWVGQPIPFAPGGPDGEYTLDYRPRLATDSTFAFTAGDPSSA